MPKYNIAFIPTQNADDFIRYAEITAQTPTSATYLLGAASIPHVSLCHFEAKEENIESIWARASQIHTEPLALHFSQRRNKTYPHHPKWDDVCWVSLISDKLDLLKKIHLQVAEIIKTPLNSAFDAYDPHLTLFNSKNYAECEKLNHEPVVDPALSDNFIMVLGEIDSVGQLINLYFFRSHCDMS